MAHRTRPGRDRRADSAVRRHLQLQGVDGDRPSTATPSPRSSGRMELDGIDGVYLVSPSLDGRPVGKFVARDNFERMATNGIGLHPLAMTDFRATLWGQPIGFNEDDRGGHHRPRSLDVPPAPLAAAAGPRVLLLLRHGLGRPARPRPARDARAARAHVRGRGRREHDGRHRARADVASQEGERRARAHGRAVRLLRDRVPRGVGADPARPDRVRARDGPPHLARRLRGQVPGRGQPVPRGRRSPTSTTSTRTGSSAGSSPASTA